MANLENGPEAVSGGGGEKKTKRRRAIWKTILIRIGQGILICYGICVLCNLWVIHTWRRDKTDYLAELNRIGWKDIDDSHNAWTYYAKAIETYVEAPKDIEGEEAWRQVELGGQQTYYWRRISSLTPESLGPTLDDLKTLQSLAQLGKWRAMQKADNGQIEDAIENSLTIVKMGCHLSRENMLIGGFFGFKILSLGEDTLLKIVRDQNVSRDVLAKTQNELAGIFSSGFPRVNLESEIFYTIGSIRKMIQQTGITGTKGIFFPITFLSLGSFNDYVDCKECFQTMARSDSGLADDGCATTNENGRFTFNIPKSLLKILKSNLSNYVKNRNHRNSEHEAVLTVLALKRWRAEKGAYPNRLGELVEGGFLAREPADPYAAEAMKYQNRGDDFILYSVGADRKDDDGMANSNRPWGEAVDGGGDRVFWPVK